MFFWGGLRRSFARYFESRVGDQFVKCAAFKMSLPAERAKQYGSGVDTPRYSAV
jgi:hypothetical protein